MTDMTQYGSPYADEDIARVTAVHKERYDLISVYGELSARLKAAVYYNDRPCDFPTTGDFVRVQHNPSGDSLITDTLPRRSRFSRSDFSGHAAGYVKTILEQTVAANFDYVFIMTSLNHDLNLRRVERYAALAWQSGGEPVVILTKADLCEDLDTPLAEVNRIAAGARVYPVSAVTGYGLDAIRELMTPGKTVVFLGSSGVGKSTLVNALAGEELMRVNVTRDIDDSKGRHTTTYRQLLRLPSGALVIDTPGMREIGMWNLDAGLSGAFADVEEILSRPCRFSDCKHQTEPGCSVRAALESGELSEERWESYQALLRESRFVDGKAAMLRQKQQFMKNIAKTNRELVKRKKI